MKSTESGQWVEHKLTASLDSGGTIEFLLPGSGDVYMDLANSYLFVRPKVTKADGSNLITDNPVGPVTNWLHSLFSKVEERHTRDTLDQYVSVSRLHRKALSYGSAAKETQLTSQLWYKDTAGRMDSVWPIRFSFPVADWLISKSG